MSEYDSIDELLEEEITNKSTHTSIKIPKQTEDNKLLNTLIDSMDISVYERLVPDDGTRFDLNDAFIRHLTNKSNTRRLYSLNRSIEDSTSTDIYEEILESWEDIKYKIVLYNFMVDNLNGQNYAFLIAEKESLRGVVRLAIGPKNRFITILCNDRECFETTLQKFDNLLRKSKTDSSPVFTIQTQYGGYVLKKLGSIGTNLNRSNYSEKVLKAYNNIAANIKSKDPLGRLNILSGPPGTGKTYLVRGLVNECPDSKFIYIPASMLESITGPQLLTLFAGEDTSKSIVLILEDADECLVTRDRGNIGVISTLLNLASGILGSALNIRIVATTNASKIELDKAVTRAGRLNEYVEVGKLQPEEAARCYKALKNEDRSFTEEISLADIYALVGEANILDIPDKAKLGF